MMIKVENEHLSIRLAESKAKNKKLTEYYETAIEKLSSFEANIIKEREVTAIEYNKVKLKNEKLKKQIQNQKEPSVITQLNRLETLNKQLAELKTQYYVKKEQINSYQIELIENSKLEFSILLEFPIK